nr:hypothetical protein [Tanacetum cinerariifolium]
MGTGFLWERVGKGRGDSVGEVEKEQKVGKRSCRPMVPGLAGGQWWRACGSRGKWWSGAEVGRVVLQVVAGKRV